MPFRPFHDVRTRTRPVAYTETFPMKKCSPSRKKSSPSKTIKNPIPTRHSPSKTTSAGVYGLRRRACVNTIRGEAIDIHSSFKTQSFLLYSSRYLDCLQHLYTKKTTVHPSYYPRCLALSSNSLQSTTKRPRRSVRSIPTSFVSAPAPPAQRTTATPCAADEPKTPTVAVSKACGIRSSSAGGIRAP